MALFIAAKQRETLDSRVRNGRPVTAHVVKVGGVSDIPLLTRWPSKRLELSYEYDGERHEVGLMWDFFGTAPNRVSPGDPVTVYVEEGNPDRVATASGGGSEGRLLRVPDMLIDVSSVLCFIVVVFGVERLRSGHRGKRAGGS